MNKNLPNTDQRIRTAFYGLAVCDALGAPLEFKGRRHGSANYVRDMLPNHNFNLPAGHFTDDTSMALCLAASLSGSEGKHDCVDQACRYVNWLDNGYMSSVEGLAFDVGNQTQATLWHWRKNLSPPTQNVVVDKFNEERRCGNGSLMRCLPCGLIAENEDDAITLGRQSSLVTHPHTRCVDICGIYSALVFHALRGVTKEQLLERLVGYLDFAKDRVDRDLRQRLAVYKSVSDFTERPREQISSSGYVLHSFEAALWAFFSTDSFEQGAIEVVNLGDDADTVGAIYGGLAGAFYGSIDSIPESWLKEMRAMELVDYAVGDILRCRLERETSIEPA